AFPAGVKFDKPYYVEITVNDEVLSPRYVLAASPYVLGTATVAADSITKTELAFGYSAFETSIPEGQSTVTIVPTNKKPGKHGVMLCHVFGQPDLNHRYGCTCWANSFASGNMPRFQCGIYNLTTGNAINAPTNGVRINYIAAQWEK
ncbi:MAG: hypothetical protein QXD77_00860, partial [Candidatus Aenigmatarchaeota archaeon]